MKSLLETMHQVEMKKRALEENVDALTEECAKLKAQEKVSLGSKTQDELSQQMKAALESQIESTRETHAKQVAALRDEISEKSKIVDELKEYIIISFLAYKCQNCPIYNALECFMYF